MVSADASPQTLDGFEIYAAERSRVKYDLQALLWLYARSSTSLIRYHCLPRIQSFQGDQEVKASRKKLGRDMRENSHIYISKLRGG